MILITLFFFFIRFIYVPAPHSGEVICNVLYDCLMDWNIDRKVSTVTVDNCAVNDAMINILLDKFSPSSLILGGKFFTCVVVLIS